MELDTKCQEIQNNIKDSAKHSERLQSKITPVLKERLKKTAETLHISKNELVNYILDKVLL